MRRNSWKIKAWLALAVVIGIIAGIIVAFIVQKYNPVFTGLAFFSAMVLTIILLVFIGVKTLHIGEE